MHASSPQLTPAAGTGSFRWYNRCKRPRLSSFLKHLSTNVRTERHNQCSNTPATESFVNISEKPEAVALLLAERYSSHGEIFLKPTHLHKSVLRRVRQIKLQVVSSNAWYSPNASNGVALSSTSLASNLINVSFTESDSWSRHPWGQTSENLSAQCSGCAVRFGISRR